MSRQNQFSCIYTGQYASRQMQRLFSQRYGPENVNSRSKSKKSKYTSNSKLTKSSLFKSISGTKIKNQQKVLKQINHQISAYHNSCYSSIASTPQNQKQTNYSPSWMNKSIDGHYELYEP